MNDSQKDRLRKAEDLLAQACTLIDGVSDERNEEVPPDAEVEQTRLLDSAYESAIEGVRFLENLLGMK